MKRYIEQLLEDLEGIKRAAKNNLTSLFNLPAINAYDLYHNDEHSGVKVAELIGMDQVFFPDLDYLSDFEAEKVVDSMVGVYHAHGLNPIFERCVTDKIKYGHLRYGLNHQVFPVENQVVDVEMCDYLPQYCPLYSLCSHHNKHNVCCELKNRA